MKEVSRQILSLFMAVVVLFTTSSFTINMHYCGDALVDFGLFTQAKGCGMEKAKPNNPCKNPLIAKKSCCSDQQLLKKGSDDLKISLDQITFKKQFFAVSFFCAKIQLIEEIDKNVSGFKDYSPPFIERDIQMLYETYLI